MSETFTEKLKKKYEKTLEDNAGLKEFYSCAIASSNEPTRRILNLESPVVFCNEKYKDKQEKK